MPHKRFQQIFTDLSFEKKLLGIGSALMIISIFLPWYQDLDSFKTGDMYLGITGPLYFAGFSLLLMAGLNVAVLWMDISGQKLPFVPFKPSSIYLFSGIFAFYLLMVVNSVYFHQKFGLNITMKQSQFGMFFAFIASSFLTIGGYLAGRDKASLLKEFQDGAAETLLRSEPRKPKENLRTAFVKEEHVESTPLTSRENTASTAGTATNQTPTQVGTSAETPKSYQSFRTDL